MTVSSIVVRSTAGWTGSETEFPTGIQVLDRSQLVVSLTVAGVSQELTLGLHYAIALSAAGVATVLPLAAFPATPGTVAFVRETPMTQVYDPKATDIYDAAGHEAALDRSAMRIAELSARLANLVVFKDGPPSVPSGTVLVSDGNGGATAGPTVDELEDASAEAIEAAASSRASAVSAADSMADAAALVAPFASHIGAGEGAHALATPSAAGFMSAVDKSALDTAMQPGAFGLGVEATDAAPLLSALDDPSLPSGLYRATNSTSGSFPSGAVACFVLIERYSGTWVKQTLTYRGDASTYGKTYIRTYVVSTASWRPWQRVLLAPDAGSDGAFVTDLSTSQASAISIRPAVVSTGQAQLVISQAKSGATIYPAIHVAAKIDDDSGSAAAGRVAGIYSYIEQTGSNSNAYAKSIVGVAVNAAAGDNDNTGVAGYSWKFDVAGGVGDSCGAGGATWQYSAQAGLALGGEFACHQQVGGTFASPNAGSGNQSMCLHITSNSGGARGWAAVGIDAQDAATVGSGKFGYWNGIVFGRSCFGNNGASEDGTVGINFGNNTTVYPEKAFYLGNAKYHLWRDSTSAIRGHCSTFDIANEGNHSIGLRLSTPATAKQDAYFGGYDGTIGPDGTTALVPRGGLTFDTNNYASLSACDTAGAVKTKVVLSPNTKSFYPATTGDTNLGGSSYAWNNTYLAVAPTITSDANYKQDVSPLPEAVLDAWGDVNLVVFRYIDAVQAKGDAARIHSGVIAQQVVAAFAAHGLDAYAYGLLCYDEWPEEPEQVSISRELVRHATFEQVLVAAAVVERAQVKPAVLDNDGNILEPAEYADIEVRAAEYTDGAELTPDEYQETRTVTPARPAGKKFSIRYEEALVLEAAYQRRRADRLETGHAALAARLAAIEAKLA